MPPPPRRRSLPVIGFIFQFGFGCNYGEVRGNYGRIHRMQLLGLWREVGNRLAGTQAR